jgi:hypothetical protein
MGGDRRTRRSDDKVQRLLDLRLSRMRGRRAGPQHWSVQRSLRPSPLMSRPAATHQDGGDDREAGRELTTPLTTTQAPAGHQQHYAEASRNPDQRPGQMGCSLLGVKGSHTQPVVGKLGRRSSPGACRYKSGTNRITQRRPTSTDVYAGEPPLGLLKPWPAFSQRLHQQTHYVPTNLWST